MSKTPIEKQWDKLIKQEMSFLNKCSEKKPSKLDAFLEDKLPGKLQATLQNTAFSKSFALILTRIIWDSV